MPSRRAFVNDVCRNLPAGLLAAAIPGLASGTSASGHSDRRRRITEDLTGWDRIGKHRTGTGGDARTADWLAQRVHAAGAAATIDAFDFRRRVPGDCFVTDGKRRADGVPLFDGTTTPAQGITASLGGLDDERPLALTTFEPFSGHPHSQSLQRARRSGDFRGIVAVAGGTTVKPGLAVLNADSYAAPFGPPVLQLATEHGKWLRRHGRLGKPLTLTVTMAEEAAKASNVQVRIAGRRAQLPPLIIMTPCSAWWTCTAERGGGIALWLEAVRHFAAAAPDRDVIFTANTGHELGHVGLERFLAREPTLAEGAHAWVHLGANFAARDGEVYYQASDDGLLTQGQTLIHSALGAPPQITPVGQRPLGEARNIFDAGGRYVSILGTNPLFHHPDDRWPHAVDLAKTERLTGAMLELIIALSRA